MSALRDPKLEKFAQALADNLMAGVKRSAAAEQAAETAGYGGASLAANARKRARRPDVQKRVAEFKAPKQQKAESQIEANKDWARQRLAAIAGPDLGQKKTKVSDQIAAIRTLAEIEGWKAPEQVDNTMTIIVKGGLPE